MSKLPYRALGLLSLVLPVQSLGGNALVPPLELGKLVVKPEHFELVGLPAAFALVVKLLQLLLVILLLVKQLSVCDVERGVPVLKW